MQTTWSLELFNKKHTLLHMNIFISIEILIIPIFKNGHHDRIIKALHDQNNGLKNIILKYC